MDNPYQPPKTQFDVDPPPKREGAIEEHLGLRWGRMKFLIAFLAAWIFLSLIAFLVGVQGPLQTAMMFGIYAVFAYIARFRLRDFGANPNYCWLMMIPLINLLMAIFLACRPGHEGANQYGYPGA